MATANIEFIDEEFVTCGVCMNEYDELKKLPKCKTNSVRTRNCSHTICLTCLEGILQDKYPIFVIKCPFCRNVSEHDSFVDLRRLLPNNIYALHIIKLNKQIALSTNSDKLEQSWCFSCGSGTIDSCSNSNHHTIDLTVGTIKNLETFAKVKQEARIKKEIDILTSAVAKGKYFQKHLELLAQSVEFVQKEIKELQQENILRLTHMSSKLAALKTPQPTEGVSHDKPTNFFSSELWSLLNDYDSTMMGAGKEKLNESIDAYCKESLDVASEAELCKKLRILVKFVDENNRVVPECLLLIRDGYSWGKVNGSDVITKVTDPFVRQESVLLSYVVFSLLQRQNMFHLLSGTASTGHEDSD